MKSEKERARKAERERKSEEKARKKERRKKERRTKERRTKERERKSETKSRPAFFPTVLEMGATLLGADASFVALGASLREALA